MIDKNEKIGDVKICLTMSYNTNGTHADQKNHENHVKKGALTSDQNISSSSSPTRRNGKRIDNYEGDDEDNDDLSEILQRAQRLGRHMEG